MLHLQLEDRGDAEVGQRRLAEPRLQDVLRFDITVQHAEAVRALQRTGDAHPDVQSRRHRERTALSQLVGQRTELKKLHCQVRVATVDEPRVEHRDDVRVVAEPPVQRPLALEASLGPPIGDVDVQDLERHPTVVTVLRRLVHGRRCSVADDVECAVALDARLPAWCGRWRRSGVTILAATRAPVLRADPHPSSMVARPRSRHAPGAKQVERPTRPAVVADRRVGVAGRHVRARRSHVPASCTCRAWPTRPAAGKTWHAAGRVLASSTPRGNAFPRRCVNVSVIPSSGRHPAWGHAPSAVDGGIRRCSTTVTIAAPRLP